MKSVIYDILRETEAFPGKRISIVG